ncbi:hypothetical protein STENM36S_04612 [Streptomyces tendae]
MSASGTTTGQVEHMLRQVTPGRYDAYEALLRALATPASGQVWMLLWHGQAGSPDAQYGNLTGTGVRLFVMILVIGFFGWPYIGRVVRGQTLSMREREYVEAARSLGAGRFYILFKELLPNLVAPIIVYTTMMIPTNILTEAALSFLGVGVEPPRPRGGRCSRARSTTTTRTPCTW